MSQARTNHEIVYLRGQSIMTMSTSSPRSLTQRQIAVSLRLLTATCAVEVVGVVGVTAFKVLLRACIGDIVAPKSS
jgi:hypothetical protein